MKCDNLIGRTFDGEVYVLASEAMEAIAELKQKLENVQASMYCDVVDANMENRRLKRALYKACANWAHCRVFVRFKTDEKAWENVERKCRAKAEEYGEGK